MNHPAKTDLALYSGSDAGLLTRLRVGRHLKNCPGCQKEVNLFRSTRGSALRQSGQMPEGLDWDSMAREMRAKIHVGVAAARCIAEAPVRRRFAFEAHRFAPTAAAVAVFCTGGWLVYTQSVETGLRTATAQVQPDGRAANEVVLHATVGGVEISRAGRSMALTYAGRGTAATISVAGVGSVNARYVDEESGQVTIHHVYAE